MLLILLNVGTKVDNYFENTKKTNKKCSKTNFSYILFGILLTYSYLCTRFFSKHYDFSCDGELSKTYF